MTRIVLISDTHEVKPLADLDLPDGDILIHAGDWSNVGSDLGVMIMANQFKALIPKYKLGVVLTAGNHEVGFEKYSPWAKKRTFEGLYYLEHESVELGGLKIFGSPYTPEFSHGWAYNVPRGKPLVDMWAQIPDDTQILITHGPPYGYGDYAPYSKENVGCEDLLARVGQLKELRAHIFGHIHPGYGWSQKAGHEGPIFVNASTVDENYIVAHKPIVIETDPIWQVVFD